jgi:broad specificity phosphatase PhoE
MTTLLLIRHGQTDWNLQHRLQGQLAVPLNAVGIAQTRSAASKLRLLHFDAIFSSDLLRAKQTAEIIAGELGLPIQFDPRLREICLGRWEGHTVLEAGSRFPEDVEFWVKNPIDWRVPGGGESTQDVATRMQAFANQVARQYPAGKLLVVSHGQVIGTLTCLSRGEPLSRAYDLTPENAEIVQIEWII